MVEAWPALCTLGALVALLVLIIRFHMQAFVGLLIASLMLGLAAGMQPTTVLGAMGRGIGDILRGVMIVLGLGAMLGRILEASGAAEVIARTLVNAFGVKRAPVAILAAAFVIGLPILFNVGFLLLIPIMWRLQRETGRSLLYFVLPLCFSLSTVHSLVPPHPGIVGAVGALKADMVQTMIFGTLLSIPIVLVGWFGPGQFWASRQFIALPEHLAGTAEAEANNQRNFRPSFGLSVLIVTMPLLLSTIGFGAELLHNQKLLPDWMTARRPVGNAVVYLVPGLEGAVWYSAADWLFFLGHPTMALLIPTGLASWLLGARAGLNRRQLSTVAEKAIVDVGSMAFLFGAAGGFMQVIKESGAGDYIAQQAIRLPLSPVLIAYIVAVLCRIALGSATAAILTASAVLAGLAHSLPGQETLLVLAVANGVTFGTQPADSGFWLVKEYCNLSVRDVMFKFNPCRMTMSATGILILLAVEAMFF